MWIIATSAKIADATRKPVRCEFMHAFSHVDLRFVSKKPVAAAYDRRIWLPIVRPWFVREKWTLARLLRLLLVRRTKASRLSAAARRCEKLNKRRPQRT